MVTIGFVFVFVFLRLVSNLLKSSKAVWNRKKHFSLRVYFVGDDVINYSERCIIF